MAPANLQFNFLNFYSYFKHVYAYKHFAENTGRVENIYYTSSVVYLFKFNYQNISTLSRMWVSNNVLPLFHKDMLVCKKPRSCLIFIRSIKTCEITNPSLLYTVSSSLEIENYSE